MNNEQEVIDFLTEIAKTTFVPTWVTQKAKQLLKSINTKEEDIPIPFEELYDTLCCQDFLPKKDIIFFTTNGNQYRFDSKYYVDVVKEYRLDDVNEYLNTIDDMLEKNFCKKI